MRPPKEIIRSLLPRSLKRHAVLAGPLRGIPLVTSWHDYPGAVLGRTERPLLEWFRRNVSSGETWIDVGAHYGYTAVGLARLTGASGRVIAFEPVLRSAACLQQTRDLNHLAHLHVVPLALSDQPSLTPLDLPVFRGMADSTLWGQQEPERIYSVSLDSIWPSLCSGSDAVHGVKVDVQGMETVVLSGMRSLLLRHQPKLVIEFHQGVDRRQMIDVLVDAGFNPAGVSIDTGSRIENGRYEDNKSYYFTSGISSMSTTGNVPNRPKVSAAAESR